ncbi:hypothetical protein A1O3_00837 [Capronia epimyces CBS 606.96]|uniref:Box C/D snoRNA protein 1 n=1 Tax=Capronia epimyces CBS 606.96 TaxID=1182542 RepID=W9YHB1_9EURO|nr:uncharacterized protein A1O3_00837 [Capronia epimyces CBS 606.96]EXJ92287.1 hypothetical protein A1O3_00837 [Capronia epimyces CBS 606.96]
MQESDSTPLLTDLCAICHANPIKYTCPRCGIHTCSLPCVKRHKTWAQCSGIRNPAAYRKRADLATPASVDQDFNFLTSVERSLQRADDLVLEKNIKLAPSGTIRGGNEPKRKFETEVQERGIRLIRAPHGLSRNKENKSHWARQYKCIMWTTEWLCFDGRKRFQNVTESRTVGEAFVNIFGKNALRKKRKRSDAQSTIRPVTQPDVQQTSVSTEAIEGPGSSERKAETSDTGPADETQSPPQSGVIEPDAISETPAQLTDASQLLRNLHFYLLKPHTMSKLQCLIPVSHTSTLTEVLRDKTILEFPTFYVREEAPGNLPEPYITEQKYDELYGSEVILDLPAYAPKDKVEDEENSLLPDIDENKVLEVLQKDLAG